MCFAVGFLRVRSGSEMPPGELLAGVGESLRDPIGGVVCHDLLDGDTMLLEPSDSACKERRAGVALLVTEDRGIRWPGMVVDADAHVRPSGAVAYVALVAAHAAADQLNRRRLLDIQPDQLAQPLVLVPPELRGRLRRPTLANQRG